MRSSYIKCLIITLVISAMLGIGVAVSVSDYVTQNFPWTISPESIKDNGEGIEYE